MAVNPDFNDIIDVLIHENDEFCFVELILNKTETLRFLVLQPPIQAAEILDVSVIQLSFQPCLLFVLINQSQGNLCTRLWLWLNTKYRNKRRACWNRPGNSGSLSLCSSWYKAEFFKF